MQASRDGERFDFVLSVTTVNSRSSSPAAVTLTRTPGHATNQIADNDAATLLHTITINRATTTSADGNGRRFLGPQSDERLRQQMRVQIPWNGKAWKWTIHKD